MTSLPASRLITADELYSMPDDGKFYELVHGRLITVPPSSWLSSLVATTLATIVNVFVRQQNLGWCAGEQGGVKLASNPDFVRAPDLSFVRRERLPAEGVRAGYFDGPPDLAAEVLSPSDRYADVARKVQEYLDAGVRLVWVIDPAARSAVVYRPGRPPRIVSGDGALDGEDVLPGFSVPLAHLWEGLAPEE